MESERSDSLGGILAMCAAMTCFIVSDVFTKLATARLPIGETITLRGLISVAIFLIPVLIGGTLPLLRERAHALWGMRVLAEMSVALTFVAALAHQPIANVVAISQLSPLILVALGSFWLGESVGWRRWIATTAGFGGMLLIVKPGVGSFNAWSLLAVAAMLFIIARDLATRGMRRDIPATLVTLTTAAGVASSGLLLLPFEAPWRQPSALEWGYLSGAALAVASAYYFSIEALRRAELSTVAPFRYVILPLSIVAGIVVWKEIPDALSLMGIAIITIAGVAIFLEERRRKRAVST